MPKLKQKDVVLVIVNALLLVPVFLAGQCKGTMAEMRMVQHPEAPAHFVKTSHGVRDLLSGGEIHYNGTRRMIGYRVAWLVQSCDGRIVHHLGEWMNVPAGVSSGSRVVVPAQGIPPSLVKDRGATNLSFFVGAVRYSDRDEWQADLRHFERLFQQKIISSKEVK